MTTILITSMGGTGSLNLVDTLRLFDAERNIRTIGTHFDPYELAKSDLADLFLVPKVADEEAYLDAHAKLIEQLHVNFFIANSDKEVSLLSRNLDRLACAHLLPKADLVRAVQDKYHFYEILHRHGCAVVPNVPVKSRDELATAVASLAVGKPFWIRLRSGSGSVGAARLNTAEEALKWVDLWCAHRSVRVEDFILAPFLGGRDFCVSTLWQDGDLVVAKVYERLAYYSEDVSLSNMGSTPKVSVTVADHEPIEKTLEAVEAVCNEFNVRPHGLYQADLKGDKAGVPYVTELNIGRFLMTSHQHDRVGKYNLFQLYLKLGLDSEAQLPRGVYDLDPGKVILRGLDMPSKFVLLKEIEALKNNSA